MNITEVVQYLFLRAFTIFFSADDFQFVLQRNAPSSPSIRVCFARLSSKTIEVAEKRENPCNSSGNFHASRNEKEN